MAGTFVLIMKNLTFALIRIECCNQYKDTPCRVALVGVKNFEIVEQKEFFIDPLNAEFDFMTSGTTLEDLRGKGSFAEQFPALLDFIKQYPVLVSTADGYDADVLFNAITLHKVECGSLPYMTAKNVLRRAYDSYSYQFDYLCDKMGVSVEGITPMDFAIAWCQLLIKACADKEFADLLMFAEENRIVVGSISLQGYERCHIKRIYKPKKKEVTEYDPANFDETHPFFDRNVVFTGKLTYFLREDAEYYVERIGGHCSSGLTKATSYLVVGVQSPSQVGPDGLSAKQKKAIKYREEGMEIELLNETDFIDIMGLQHVVDFKKYVEDTFYAPLRKNRKE